MKLSVENEYDKAIDALAELRLQCAIKAKHKICDDTMCINCVQAKHYNACYNELTTMDKIRVDTLTEQKILEYIDEHEPFVYKKTFDSSYLYTIPIGIGSSILFIVGLLGIITLIISSI